jgi:hypothetical protein
MHARFVAPQQHWADRVLRHDLGNRQVRELAQELRAKLDVLRSSSTNNGE